MSRWRRLNYSASLAVTVAALAAFAYRQGGELLLVPGMFLQGVSELVLTLLLSAHDEFYFLPRGSHVVLTAACYFPAIYILSCVVTGLKERAKRS